MSQIVLATGNQGKVKELANMLAPLNVEIVAQSAFNVPDVPETGTTFIENAIIKARHAAKLTGKPAIADDSGLEVRALKGAPGIYSARFSGEGATDQSNIDKLLVEMATVPTELRQARFVCVLVYMRHEHDPTPLICQGFWDGTITTEQSGRDGFGYDPVFYAPESNCTSAELSKEQKNKLSHRGKALAALLPQLTTELSQLKVEQ
ncbi:XTP/dITP diphosphatase [Psychrobium sp. 1_MG-2023]|uniref:XTP/dITP diphosphatase n=1 Tax=Psychrobium sp. 1_MG-2023 TaxID=3062624 RepID=UPI000C33DF61|nr:XTP/dITP diphosphatase [Psychrobium sp. 1_MG-2023]MDP2562368.1 XTP/dITP diphosphatase [Psychrobium sp. 1_MG-2023]PKF55866.1 non-canonical purine NTP pyrophosphatase [Alteromonadales bacterium alter-6D02]